LIFGHCKPPRDEAFHEQKKSFIDKMNDFFKDYDDDIDEDGE
jgi:hypothetical protein